MVKTGWGRSAVVLVALLGVLGYASAAERKIPAQAKAAFEGFASAWSRRNSREIIKYFPAEQKVRIDVDSVSGDFSRDQASEVLRKYFEGIRVVKLELKNGEYSGDETNPIARYVYEYEQANRKYSAELLVSCLQVDGEWSIVHVSK